jgi:hypothetical protein
MNEETRSARLAIESLRSGVPSRHAVSELGTTQDAVQERFMGDLEALKGGQAVSPLVVAANFGAGKTHLLEYLQMIAERHNFVTSYLVVSPEMPLGRAHVVLQAIARSAVAPNKPNEKALRALTQRLKHEDEVFRRLEDWVKDAGLHDRFCALLYLYTSFRHDEEFRVQVLQDFEGKPIQKTEIRKRLKEMGQLSAYDLTGPRSNLLLAPDRIRLLAQIFRACGTNGLIVLFDELERIARFTRKQRIAAYQQLDWWRRMSEQPGAAIYPVFAMTESNWIYEDEESAPQISMVGPSGDLDARDGIALLKEYMPLENLTDSQQEKVLYRIKQIYERAYGIRVEEPPKRQGVYTSIRSEIRRWITHWDLMRYDPAYRPEIVTGEVTHDTSEIEDEELAPEQEEEVSEE